jgi:Trk K+ transport system NAD-binding subunit
MADIPPMANTPAPVEPPSFGDKLRYQVDRFLSWSPLARFFGLFLLSFLLISINAGAVRFLMPPEEGKNFGFLEGYWWATTRVLDSGTMGQDNEKGWIVAALAIFTTLCGVGVVALLIGLVSSTIGDKIDDLRKGKSPVIDEGHSLILGYGEKIFAILRELREANSNQSHASIVILSPSDKEEVETAVRERMGDMRTTRVVVRQGSPYSPADLKKVGAGRARSIIVLASDTGEEGGDAKGNADMGAIKTLLALRRVPGALTRNHAVVELIDSSRKSVVEQIGAGGVEVVSMEETLSRMMVQTARQNGLAQVYRDLLTYEGSEFYFRNFPELAGQPFSAAQWKMKDAVVAGVRRPPQTILNPAEDFVLEANDELLVIAEDDDTFALLPAPQEPAVPESFQGATPIARKPERLWICGNSPKLPDMIREFDNYVLPGSEAWLMPGMEKEAFAEFIKGQVGGLKNLKLKYVEGDPTAPDALKRAASPDFACALVVADTSAPEDEADAHTVITVLLLRALFAPYGEVKPRIISEILDPRTKDLIERDYGADFVVSSEMTSMLLAQVSERRELNAVFADLFDADGNEVYLKRAECYATVGQSSPWLTVQKVARARGEVAIGYMKARGNPLINPPQKESVLLEAGDRVIVISEDDSEAKGDARGSELAEAPAEAPAPAPPLEEPKPEPRKPARTMVMPAASLPPVKTVSEGPRIQGPSTTPRAPLPPKKA